jgi:RcsF protein
MRFRLQIVTAATLMLSACGAFVPQTNIGKLAPEEQAEVQAVRIYNSAQLTNAEFEVVGMVEGISCQNKLWDPPASRSAALDQARYSAVKIGANGLTNIQFGGREGTSVRTNCWEMITVTAEALQIARGPQR